MFKENGSIYSTDENITMHVSLKWLRKVDIQTASDGEECVSVGLSYFTVLNIGNSKVRCEIKMQIRVKQN